MDYKKIILKPVGIAMIFVVLLLAGIFVLQNDITNRATAYNKDQTDLFNNSAAIKNIVYLQVDAQKAEKYFPIFNNYLMPRDQLINFSKDLNVIAQKNNFDFNVSFGTETVPIGDQPRKTDISLSAVATGNLRNFVNFLRALENSYYIVNFTSVDTNQESSQINVNLGGKIFTL